MLDKAGRADKRVLEDVSNCSWSVIEAVYVRQEMASSLSGGTTISNNSRDHESILVFDLQHIADSTGNARLTLRSPSVSNRYHASRSLCC